MDGSGRHRPLWPVRAASRRPTRYDGAAVDTPFGIVQPELVTQIVRGPDLVAALPLAAFALR